MQPIVGMTASSSLYPHAKNIILPTALVCRNLLLLGVLKNALGFQASPRLLKSPSLNAVP